MSTCFGCEIQAVYSCLNRTEITENRHQKMKTEPNRKKTVAALVTRGNFFLATCNENLGKKVIAGFCRILDICKLFCDLHWDSFANYKCYRR